MGRPAWLGELHTVLTGVDPGFARLRLAGTGTASMALAAGAMAAVRAATGQAVTLLLLAAVLAMVSNLAVHEPDPRRRRITTALMLGPAVASVTAGTLLAPHRLVADAVFVVIMIAAVYVRRFGPRGFALGMAAFMPYFFTQFLHAQPAQLPWLLLAAAIGISSTLLVGLLFAERPERTLARQLRAFRSHVHALVAAVADLLGSDVERDGDRSDDSHPDRGAGGERRLHEVRKRRERLNDTALLVGDTLDRLDEHGSMALQVVDVELAAERLAVAGTRLVLARTPTTHEERSALLSGLGWLLAASASGTPPEMADQLLDGAERSVAELEEPGTHERGPDDRVQRVALAITRLATALRSAPAGNLDPRSDEATETAAAGDTASEDDETTGKPDEQRGLLLTTRQAVQVGVATALAIVVGELVSPARWYWAVITAFVVFAGTTSRGDLLSRAWQRTIGTVGGVLAGMGLAVLVSGRELPAILLLFACVFLALYLVRVSQALMAFWITAVLALLYGLIGQFSVATLVLRIEETAAGALLGMLAGFLVLPKRTREAFGEALDDLVDVLDAALTAATDRLLGRLPSRAPGELAREVHDDMATVRARAAPLQSPVPWRRRRSGYARVVQALTAVEYYARSFVRLSDGEGVPGWTRLDPAVARVRSNLDVLRRALLRRDPGEFRSAEDLVDAADAEAAHATHQQQARLLAAARMLRRIDQSVIALATDLGLPGAGAPGEDAERPAAVERR